MKKLITFATLLALAGAGFAELQDGDVILLYGRGTSGDGTSAEEYDSQTWNRVKCNGATNGDLMLTTGFDSGVIVNSSATASVLNKTGGSLTNVVSWVTANAPLNTSVSAGSMTLTFSGLDTAFTYNISFATDMTSNLYDGQTNTVNGVSKDYSPFSHAGDVYENVWENVELINTDQIVIDVVGNPGERGVIGMIRIETIDPGGQPGSLFIIK